MDYLFSTVEYYQAYALLYAPQKDAYNQKAYAGRQNNYYNYKLSPKRISYVIGTKGNIITNIFIIFYVF